MPGRLFCSKNSLAMSAFHTFALVPLSAPPRLFQSSQGQSCGFVSAGQTDSLAVFVQHIPPFGLLGSHLPCASIGRMVRRIWACGLPLPVSWMLKSAHIPLKQTERNSTHGQAVPVSSLDNSMGRATPQLPPVERATPFQFAPRCSTCPPVLESLGALGGSRISEWTILRFRSHGIMPSHSFVIFLAAFGRQQRHRLTCHSIGSRS